MLVECIIHSIKSFPQTGSISKGLGSITILLRKPSTDFNIKMIFFGSYAMVYIGTTNTLKRRSTPSIALRGLNEDVGHFFMSIYTGKDISSNDWV